MTSVTVFMGLFAVLLVSGFAYSETSWDDTLDWIDTMDYNEEKMGPENYLNEIKIDFGSGEQCEYPGGNCYQLRLQRVHGCTSFFSIHGFWPQWASKCDNSASEVSKEDFDPAFQKILLKEWPTCKGNDHEWFWSHEWRKHGTCAKSFKTMQDYFEATVFLARKYRYLCNRPDMDGLYRKVHSHNKNAEECGICFNRKMTKIIDCA